MEAAAPRAAIYARVSTDEQARPGLASIPHQIAECRKLAAAVGIPVSEADIFVDDETGQHLDRPGLAQLLVQLSDYSHVFLYDPTRLARRRQVALVIREELARRGVQLRLVQGDTSSMDEESRVFLESIQDAASEAEIIRFMRRTRMGRERRAEQGLHTGKVPLGWRVIRDGRGRSIGLEPDPAWDRFFADLEELFLSGTPYNRLPRLLLARGHVCPSSGRMWMTSSLRYILHNPTNYGDLVFGRAGKRWKNLITREGAFPCRWKNPQAMRAEARRREGLRGRGTWQVHPFSGLLRCAYCGWKLVISTRTRRLKSGAAREIKEYRCGKYAQFMAGRWPDRCKPNFIQEKKVADQLGEWFRRMTDKDAVEEFLTRRAEQNRTEAAEELRLIEGRLARVDRKLAGLAERLALVPEGALSAVRARMQQLVDEKEALAARRRELHSVVARTPDQAELRRHLLSLASRADELLAEAPPHMVQAELHRLFPDGIYVDRGKLLLP